MSSPVFEAIMARMVDPRRPQRFEQERNALGHAQVLSEKGFYSPVDMEVLLNVFSEYLQSKGY